MWRSRVRDSYAEPQTRLDAEAVNRWAVIVADIAPLSDDQIRGTGGDPQPHRGSAAVCRRPAVGGRDLHRQPARHGRPRPALMQGVPQLVGTCSRAAAQYPGVKPTVYTSAPDFRTWIYDTARGAPAAA